jgi:hypothetical protein
MAGRELFPAVLCADRDNVCEPVRIQAFEIVLDLFSWRADDIDIYTEPVQGVLENQSIS